MSKAPLEEKDILIDALKLVFTADTSIWIRPNEFGEQFINDTTLKSYYTAKVVTKLPATIEKSSELLDFNLNNRRVNFGEYYISGPDKDFQDKVKVVKTREELENIDFSDPNHTILIMPGKPHLNKPRKQRPDGLPRKSPVS